ncbi:TraY domain-containing protein [Erwinia amylovora]|jgi:hypothetical protein|uniref:TraY domain-containing protein n=1 Tax=Erwinia amylovora TaxID=552 RepID=UPI0001CCB901|nr:TraY domain-containing protein [Erwinia amylovora]CBJ48244.1 conjugal transfer protein [Erwinia amylovora ATCC 49946]
MPTQVNKKGVSVLLHLNTEQTEKLSQAAERSGRSKTKEALFRLTDHLDTYSDLATPGIRFKAEETAKSK